MIRMGNIQLDEVREFLGFELNEKDKQLWKKYHNNRADLSGMDNCFHVFMFPTCIVAKGEEVKDVIIEMFSIEKCVEPKGEIKVTFIK